MSFSFGVFDIYANIIPGSMYMSVMLYLADRYGRLDIEDLGEIDTTILILGFAIAAYLLGQVLGPAAGLLTSRIPLWKQTIEDARREFVERNEDLVNRRFVQADPHTLLAGIRHSSVESAATIDMLKAQGILLRNMSLGFFVGGTIAVLEVAFGSDHAFAATSMLILVSMSLLALRQGRRLTFWSWTATFEAAVWLPAPADDN